MKGRPTQKYDPDFMNRKYSKLFIRVFYSDLDLLRHFRVSQATFSLLLEHFRADNFRGNVKYHGGFHPVLNASGTPSCR
jgi:hypothetical protein